MATNPPESSPDAQATAALNELIHAGAGFRRMALFTPEQDRQYGDDPDFPPIPCYLSTVSLAYLEDSGLTRRKFADTSPGITIDREAAREDHLRAASAVEGLNIFSAGTLEDVASEQYHAQLLDKISRLGRRTIAAVVTYSSPDSNQHFSGLVIPRPLARDVPLELRESLLQARAEGISSGVDTPEQEYTIRQIIQNHPSAELSAFLLLAKSLPNLASIEKAIAAAPIQSHASSVAVDERYAGLSRTERRKLQAKERRSNRRRQ